MKYYEFNADLVNSTDKAYAVGTGEYRVKNGYDAYGRDRGFQYEVLKYIPKSQCITKNNRTFVKGWLVAQNNLWNIVDTNYYTIEDIENLNNETNKLNLGDMITINAMDIANYADKYEMEFVKNEGLNITLKIKAYK